MACDEACTADVPLIMGISYGLRLIVGCFFRQLDLWDVPLHLDLTCLRPCNSRHSCSALALLSRTSDLWCKQTV